MTQLNKTASELMLKYNVHACTDITGFGLAGHASNIAAQSNVSLIFYIDKLPVYPTALEQFKKGNKTGASQGIEKNYSHKCYFESNIENYYKEIFFDPQTSGGLLIAVDENDANKLLVELLANNIVASLCGTVADKSDYYIIASK
jgi:selenide,water dikinase